jgi:hypothetical protein
MEPLNDLYKVTPEELIDSLSDGPRPLLLNPDPVEVQELLSEVHADLGDRDPKWSSDEDGRLMAKWWSSDEDSHVGEGERVLWSDWKE